MADFKLLVVFDEGRRVIYDVADDIESIEAFRELRTLPGLFANARLDSSRTCVVWNARIDLPSDTIYEYGVTCLSGGGAPTRREVRAVPAEKAGTRDGALPVK